MRDIRAVLNEIEVPAAVFDIAIQHGADQSSRLQHEPLVDATARIAQDEITGNLQYGIRAQNGGQILSYGNNRIYENGTNGAPTSVIGQD